MSKKNKGFVLLETIIVMSVLLIGMILLYSNYNRIFMNSGKISYYDNVEVMYTAYYVYLNKDTINTSSNGVVDVSDNEVLKNLGIERIYFIDKDVFTNLYTKEVSNCENLDSLNCFDGSTIAYLKSIYLIKILSIKEIFIVLISSFTSCSFTLSIYVKASLNFSTEFL